MFHLQAIFIFKFSDYQVNFLEPMTEKLNENTVLYKEELLELYMYSILFFKMGCLYSSGGGRDLWTAR